MISLRCPVCGNPVDEAIDGGCSKRCDDIFHGVEEMTDNKAAQQAVYIGYDTGGNDESALFIRKGDKVIGIVHGELADAIQEALTTPPAQPVMGDDVVQLTYFKTNGKYYSSGAFKVCGDKHISEICEVVRALVQLKRLPDLIEGHSDFDVLVEYRGVPHFIRAATQSPTDAQRQAALEDLAKVDYHPRSVDDGHYDAGFDQEQAGDFLDKHIRTVYAALQSPAVPREVVERARYYTQRGRTVAVDTNTTKELIDIIAALLGGKEG